MKDFYAIEVVGYRYYVVKAVYSDMLIPVSGAIVHRTLEGAKAEADRRNLEIQSVGDLWEILADFSRKNSNI